MDDEKNFRLMDLIEDIKNVDEMIKLHSSNSSTFMLEQYSLQKDKLIGYFIDELVAPELRSPKSFAIIKNVIDKFYPHINEEARADKLHDNLNEIELALAS